ncbi:serine/threonine protein kinase [Arthrobacter zhaoxinii]|uniref:non-specific serine/threonine protein kinase n=1 Tax=Arthrobacter zhaoxinii TaxID=2964616 RepID=A0ABY5YVH5_9MICC|nr:serine/threonine-protein kinase [Arthrobacter zhaoxinii]UWX98279.1 serine/threonine protein kinase [Arthrobacter zhaoxinii]
MDTTPLPDPDGDRRGGIPVPPAPDVPGFRVDRLLGVGGTAAVWLVRDLDGAPFALKVPVRGADGGVNTFEARREVNILSRLEHPHLLQVHAVVETDQGTGLLGGYAPGGSAAGLVAARGPVQPGEAVSILVGIAGALGYLHARGTAHGDVSPGNILFTPEGRPLLADFGSGRLLGEPGAPHPGTPGFSAPERRDGADAGLGAASDIYSLAAVGWFLLTGRIPPPSRSRPPLSILVPGVGRELPALLEAGLAEDAALRPGAGEFAAAAYRSVPALPVDLVAAVHPDVHPELLTRRTESAGSGAGGRKRWWRRPGRRRGGAGAAGRAVRQGRGRNRGRERRRERDRERARTREQSLDLDREQSRDRDREQETGQGRRRRAAAPPRERRIVPVAAAAVVAAVLVLAVIALAAPELLSARSTAPEARNGSIGDSTGAARDTTAPAAPAPSPGNAELPGTAGKSVDSLLSETAAQDPAQALPALAELRTRAFTGADPVLLDHVNAPESEAQLADQEQVGRLAADGHTLAGLVMTVDVLGRSGPAPPEAALPPDPTPGTAELRVRMQVSAYTHMNRTGEVLRQEPAQQQEVLLVLVRNEGMWRISRVLAAS